MWESALADFMAGRWLLLSNLSRQRIWNKLMKHERDFWPAYHFDRRFPNFRKNWNAERPVWKKGNNQQTPWIKQQKLNHLILPLHVSEVTLPGMWLFHIFPEGRLAEEHRKTEITDALFLGSRNGLWNVKMNPFGVLHPIYSLLPAALQLECPISNSFFLWILISLPTAWQVATPSVWICSYNTNFSQYNWSAFKLEMETLP